MAITDDGINQPDLTGDPDSGTIGGVTVGPTPPQTPPVLSIATNPSAPQKILQQTWRPQSFLDFHLAMAGADDKTGAGLSRASQASRELDTAIKVAHQNDAVLQSMIASTQFGSTIVTGKSLMIPTGLVRVRRATGSISQGATAHNFWVSVNISQTPGAIDIYVWQPTAAGDNTPIACTTAVTVQWSVTGDIS